MKAIATLTLILFLTGCNEKPVSSNAVANTQLSAKLEVISGAGTSVQGIAQFTTISNGTVKFVNLVDGEHVLFSKSDPTASFSANLFSNSANFGSSSKILTRRTIISGQPEYFTVLNNSDNTNIFYISFIRTKDVSVLNSSVSLPDDFLLTAPQDNTIISRTNDINLQWSDSGTTDTMSYDMTGTCELSSGAIDNVYITLAITGDTGSHTIKTSDFVSEIAESTSTCLLSIVLQRSRNGILNNEFGLGGSIRGIQQQVVSFTSTP